MSRAVRAMAMFGVDPEAQAQREAALRRRWFRLAAEIDGALAPGEVVAMTGASGAGKSSVLAMLRRRIERRGGGVIVCARGGACDGRPIVERVGGSIEEAMGLLASAGLAEAGLLARTEGALSEGQRARFELALAMDRARGMARGAPAPVTILVDEFGSGLDEATARALACSFGRWVQRTGVRAAVACCATDVGFATSALRAVGHPCPEAPMSQSRHRWHGAHKLAIRIERGGRADYEALAEYHYAAGRPGPIAGVLRAIDERSEALAGVLVVSMPPLNARWRRLAWPGRYEDPDRRARARRINEEVRIISRVIVDPRFRACGVATRLVRAYLADPLTCATEAVTAMGGACPLFERAGMTPIRMAQRPEDGRLARALGRRGLEAEGLADPVALAAMWEDVDLRAELRRWANASRRTRRLLTVGPSELGRHAARALLAEPVAYVARATDVGSATSVCSSGLQKNTEVAKPTSVARCEVARSITGPPPGQSREHI